MRKTRKVIADVTASPSIPPPQPANEENKPLCLFCYQKPPVQLNLTHSRDPEPTVFCCATCAATWALVRVRRWDLKWCSKHRAWSSEAGECGQCWIEEEAAKRNSYIKATKGKASKSEVSNEQ